MMHVSILVPEGHTSLPNIDGTLQILQEVNTFRIRLRKPPLFQVELVGLHKKIKQRNGLYTVQPDKIIGEIEKTDLIIIPAMHGDMAEATKKNYAFIPWLKDQHAAGAEIASFCIGAFFLAETGLLDGKKCSTHWVAANEFRALYPNIEVVDEKIMTAEDGLYTSGGAYAFLNLLVYLIEKFAGRETAIFISKAFMIDIDRFTQSPFSIFQGQKLHDDEPVKKAQEYIEENFTEKISIDDLAKNIALGRRNLERRFKKATSNTLAEYMQRVKIEVAKKGLESGKKNVSEVMYEVGYNDSKAFRNIFKRLTGMSPVDYRSKYNKHAAVLA
ncbi:MAG: helix-turn-helix domain-containing protein [Ferruginibacter sp.]